MIALLASVAFAADCTSSPEVALVYGNGMSNLLMEATASSYALDARVRPGLESAHPDLRFTSHLAFNEWESAFPQLVEVLRQKVVDDVASALGLLSGALGLEVDAAAVSAELGALFADAGVVDEDLERHVQFYRGELMAGHPIVLVGHSQGNFYANAAWDAVMAGEEGFEPESFALVGVASPADRVADGGSWITADNDLVIAAVAAVSPATLPSTAANRDTSQEDGLHHNFVATYLEGDVLGPAIVAAVEAAVDGLEVPEATVTDGVITLTLEWDEQPDVDLYVYEPDGGAVWYGDTAGTYGYLDHDDTDGFGPEHYYVSCESLATLGEPGTFDIAVDYYAGEAPTTARLQVAAGYTVRTFDVALSTPDAGANPQPVASVVVTPADDGSFAFEVQ